MYYVCIENDLIISILSYQPTVPNTVDVVEISDDDYTKISNQTHYFDLNSKEVKAYPNSVIEDKEKEVKNAEHREFLTTTDWKVLRHIREKALGIETSLSESEYLELEQQREHAANSIL